MTLEQYERYIWALAEFEHVRREAPIWREAGERAIEALKEQLEERE